MTLPIIEDKCEYSVADIVSERLVDLFRNFEIRFREYTAERLGEKFKHEVTNFNRYVGCLESACVAADTLAPNYDLGVGIAKKGLWLSFIFSLYGLPTHDILAVRNSKESRFCMPITRFHKRDVENKKIIIFDNDVVTGKTVQRVAKDLLAAGARQTDLMLVYSKTRLTLEYFEQIKPYLKNEPLVLGKTPSEKIVIDTQNQIPEYVTESFSLEKDFSPDKKNLERLVKILEART